MTPPWTIEFYESGEEGCPVRAFLDSLEKARRAKVLAVIALLGEEGRARSAANSVNCGHITERTLPSAVSRGPR